uniref:Hypothetical conserved protein n=1 Tax=uncultured prokaryote TaxID=198431 RepID=H5S957_9ZZZZ|nr:hypothetical conserved protein [uncultured prokaryote]
MPLPKRLQQELKKLSPTELQALQDWLTQLLQAHAEEKLPRKTSAAQQHYTYRQEYVKCGKKGCSCAQGQGHGPYWYAYWKEGGTLKKQYLGKTRR